MAMPLALSVPVPRVVEPSTNVTVPVGVPPVAVTMAVKVTAFPYMDGLVDDDTTVVGVALFTVCERAEAEVDVAKFVSPL